MPSILFVCMGNICRSPMAHALATHRLPGHLMLDSAGTHASGRGEPIDPRAASVLTRHGIPVPSKARARRVRAEDFEAFDLLLAMDSGNLEDLRTMCPADLSSKLQLFMDFASQPRSIDVPDPYYGSVEGFERVFALCESGIEGLRNWAAMPSGADLDRTGVR